MTRVEETRKKRVIYDTVTPDGFGKGKFVVPLKGVPTRRKFWPQPRAELVNPLATCESRFSRGHRTTVYAAHRGLKSYSTENLYFREQRDD